MTGQATSFWLKDLTKTELTEFSHPVAIRDSLLVYRDQNNFIIAGKYTNGSVNRYSKRFILLVSFKNKIRLA